MFIKVSVIAELEGLFSSTFGANPVTSPKDLVWRADNVCLVEAGMWVTPPSLKSGR